MRIIVGILLVLHGLVHMLYFGQSGRYFALQPGMVWPDGSWAFSSLLGNEAARNLAGMVLILAATGFVAGGIGLLAKQAWYRPIVVGSAVLSSAIFILFWDGVARALDDKGGIGILINLAILAVLLVLRRPHLETRSLSA